MNCFENMTVPSCVWFESGEKRNTIASIVAGALFFTGWWFLIDGSVSDEGIQPGAAHICGVFGTFSLIMVNSVSNAQIRGDTYTGGCLGARGARLWLFLGFVVGFASLIASCWILFQNYVPHDSKNIYPGVCLFLQNAMIFAGSLVFKFGRTEDTWG